MGNFDFSNHASFSWYVLLLILGGILMIGLAGIAARPLSRVLNLVVGFGFVVYGVYLGFIWRGGTYVVFFTAFLLPVLLLISTVRSGIRRRGASNAPTVAPAATMSEE